MCQVCERKVTTFWILFEGKPVWFFKRCSKGFESIIGYLWTYIEIHCISLM